ncbi:MAG: DUF469 family protein [Lentisphaerae bacterium]|nr:DUF469 family protein [Lentisphaerota bacterium]
MKKRFRKKFAVGEFYRPWFAVSAEITAMGEGDQADFVSRFIAAAEALDMVCDGAIGETELEVAFDTGRMATANEERRRQFLDQVKAWPEIVKIEATELQ